LSSIKRLLPVAATGLALVVSACGDDAGSPSAGPDCTPKYTVKTQEDGVLRVGAIQYPPYSTIKGGDVGGIDGDIMAGFAKAACLKMEADETTFAAAVSSVTSRRNDVAMGDLYRTEERAQEVALSNPVYLDELGVVSKTGLDSMKALEGKNVATVQGYYFVEDVKKTFGENVKLFPDNVKMYQDLFAGRSEAGLDSFPAAVEYLKSRGKEGEYQVKVPPVDPRIPATGEQAAQSAYAYDKSARELGEALNAYVEDIRASGELAEILSANGIPASAAEVGDPRLA
jgi:polar amino acid transport system substrate-binding protein